jgi:hypothetical protein
MIHEDAVLAVHPQASEFRPVKPFMSGFLFGWTFQVPAGREQIAKKYGWVTHDGEVSRDTLRHRDQAGMNLKTYVRTRKPISQPVPGPVEDGK